MCAYDDDDVCFSSFKNAEQYKMSGSQEDVVMKMITRILFVRMFLPNVFPDPGSSSNFSIVIIPSQQLVPQDQKELEF